MKNNQIGAFGRMAFVFSGLALFSILFFPMWQIQLSAPQYPEGLVLLIFPNKIGGNVDIINGLNHYIGMKTMHTSDFFEFTILPYIICFFSGLFIISGLVGKKKLANASFILFVCFGIIAMVDFWKWEYNYGHTLNPDAAIIVPGMSYQPPLIGFKQLLNFGAYSIPDIGGWIFVGVGILLIFVVGREWISGRSKKRLGNTQTILTALLFGSLFSSCHAGPVPLLAGRDNCQFCKMTISDIRYGAEIVSDKGKIYKFDDPQCAISFLKANPEMDHSLREIYFTDFSGSHTLVPSGSVFFLKSELLKGPMSGSYSAFNSLANADEVKKTFPGTVVRWNEISKP